MNEYVTISKEPITTISKEITNTITTNWLSGNQLRDRQNIIESYNKVYAANVIS
jgi:hypothetical protein